ncbi:MAG: hypothetical protein FD131_3074 [Rhodocyclaceae bacterium]|nr:MAG: hypothetical protein FD131_3074 [Rhodocyclaceae bacterium]
MLSYRHAFHAGNHADVLKHLILIEIAQYMAEKPAPFWIIDTHAGAGRYSLDSAHATKLSEYRDGVARLWEAKGLPKAALNYLDFVKMLNPDGQLRHYPGSPWLARQLLRDSDRLRLYEMHSTDGKLLMECFKGSGRELQDALKRFPTGTYALWYPMLGKPESRQLPEKLKRLGAANWLHATLEVKAPSRDGYGMHGSGMFIINPPWTLEKTLHDTLPTLATLLAQDAGAKYTLESEST